jgi:predicted GNAT superfamily acetyltransferase
MPNDEITIRKAETIADYLACQAAQKRAWGITDDSYLVPLATMVGAQLHGGLVLGAFTPSGEALGLSFGFLGKVEGRLCLYSQLTGVVPGQQGKGLGGRLKAAQREYAKNEGLDCLAWAFDPLQAGNAHFNLERLGATASKFVEDMYGRRTDALNANATTDRLIAEWSTESEPRPPMDVKGSPRLGVPEFSGEAMSSPPHPNPPPQGGRESDASVKLPLSGSLPPSGGGLGWGGRVASPETAVTFPRLIEANGFPVAKLEGKLSGSAVLLEIPSDIATLRREDPEQAEAWGHAVREAFQGAFRSGYRAEGFLRETDGRCSYLLRQSG